MKQILLIIIVILSLTGYGQGKENVKIFQKYEDSLSTLRELTLSAKSDAKREEYNQGFITVFKTMLSQDESYEYLFTTIQTHHSVCRLLIFLIRLILFLTPFLPN